MKKLEIIDYLRGFAIFTIALMHLVQGYLTGVLKMGAAFGGAGVHVFILCSGFGLYLSHLNHPLGYLAFLKKRFTKVYFPYALTVILYALWKWYTDGLLNFPANELVSHLLLYKMFDNTLDISICYPFWFISTIIQFYIAWPLLLKLIQIRRGIFIALLISVCWWIFVGALGYEDYRPWGSFFLQYLWEFVLGMQIAKCVKNEKFTMRDFDKKVRLWHLFVLAFIGMILTGVMGKMGEILKLFNDIPSLIGYISVLLIIYKLNIWKINKFFAWSNKSSYELYLIHSLVYGILAYVIGNSIPIALLLVVSFIFAYLSSFGYDKMLRQLNIK